MWLTLLWSLWLMSPWRVYLLMCRIIPNRRVPYWTGTHGEIISSDLHGAESPPDGCWDPNRGQRQVKGFASGKRRTFHQRQLRRPVPKGVVPFPPRRWPWEAMTSPRMFMTSSNSWWDFGRQLWHVWLVPEAQGGLAFCSKEASFWWFFGIFLGGRFTTRVWLHECLVDVCEFMQNTSLLNGYGIVYLHFVVIIC